jgi:hypothetical protein
VLLSGRPALYHLVTTTRDCDAHQAQHHSTSIAMLRTKAPEAQAQHYEDYNAQFDLKQHCNIGLFSAAPLLTPTRATHCHGNGHLFRG